MADFSEINKIIKEAKTCLMKIEEGKKELKGKLDWSCLPMDALRGTVRVFEKGVIKYQGTRTWLPGILFSKLFAATMRHLFDWYYLRIDADRESGEHPLCHVMANCLMLLTYIKNKKYDDRPKGDGDV